MDKNKTTEGFEKGDEKYWEEPDKHALVKTHYNGIDFYTIHTTEPVLSMLLCDDFDYAIRVSKKMIENGVKVFENFEAFDDWYKQRKKSEI